MACESFAGLEAQKLISISLGKMAASRVGRTGSSLHKSLLVASVLNRARHVFLEESYHVHHHREVYAPPPPQAVPVYVQPQPQPEEDKENRLAEEKQEEACECPRVAAPLGDSTGTRQNQALKRRRCVSDQETHDAVSSILPKKARTSETCSPPPEPASEPSPDAGCCEPAITDVSDDEDCCNGMEVDDITRLVSIFSFGHHHGHHHHRQELCASQVQLLEEQPYTPVALAV